MDRIWTRAEAAAYLKCSERHLDRLARAGKLTPLKFGSRAIRFRSSEVESLLSA